MFAAMLSEQRLSSLKDNCTVNLPGDISSNLVHSFSPASGGIL